ncbi:MAG: hypothetical protein ACTHJ3_16585 [Pararhizobium sp.]
MPRFQETLLLIGQLNYVWTNTESLLIYLIAGLARTDKETAIVIFLTLNATRARIELVERLAKLKRTDAECRRAVLTVTGELSRQARLRNKYSHCVYSFDATGSAGSTQMMRIFENKEEVRYGKMERLDDRELENIRLCASAITEVNKAIWAIVHRYGFPE